MARRTKRASSARSSSGLLRYARHPPQRLETSWWAVTRPDGETPVEQPRFGLIWPTPPGHVGQDEGGMLRLHPPPARRLNSIPPATRSPSHRAAGHSRVTAPDQNRLSLRASQKSETPWLIPTIPGARWWHIAAGGAANGGTKCCHWRWCIDRRGVETNDDAEGWREIDEGTHPGCAPYRRSLDHLKAQL